MSVPKADVSVCVRSSIARYETNADLTNNAINAQNLIGSLCCLAASSTVLYSVFYAMKIKKVVIYTTAVASNAATRSTTSFEWNTPSGSVGIGTKPANYVSGTLGTASGTKEVFRPQFGSVWSKWFTLNAPGSVTIWTWSIPKGTIVEIFYDAYVENNDSTVSFTPAAGGMTAGANYRLGIDGLGNSTTNFSVLGFKPAP